MAVGAIYGTPHYVAVLVQQLLRYTDMVVDVVADGSADAASFKLSQRAEAAARLVPIAGAVKVGGFRVPVKHEAGSKIRVRFVTLGDHPVVLPEEQDGFTGFLVGLADAPVEDVILIAP